MRLLFDYKCKRLILLSLLIVFFIPAITPSISAAVSEDILILQEGSQRDLFSARIGGDYIATYVKTSSPNEIKIFSLKGEMIKTVQLSNKSSVATAIDIHDNHLYYVEQDKDIPRIERLDTLYQYNIISEERQIIYTAPQYYEHIKRITAEERIIVFELEGTQTSQLLVHNLITGETHAIYTKSMVNDIATDGEYVIWGCGQPGNEILTEIHVYSISTGNTFIIPESRSELSYGSVDISGNYVTWFKALESPLWENGMLIHGRKGMEIMLTDLISGETVSLGTSRGYSRPFISGDNVLFLERPAPNEDGGYEDGWDNGKIIIYNIKTGKYSGLGSDVGSIQDIEGNAIIWSRYNPVSFWVTTFSEETENIMNTPTPPQENASPINPISIISAAMLAGLGYRLVKKKRWGM